MTQSMRHCWHDLSVKYPPGPHHTINAPTGQGRVCCYCGETRSDPLPRMSPLPHHGPYVDDSTNWFVPDEAACPGMKLVHLNLETVAVYLDDTGSPGRAS